MNREDPGKVPIFQMSPAGKTKKISPNKARREHATFFNTGTWKMERTALKKFLSGNSITLAEKYTAGTMNCWRWKTMIMGFEVSFVSAFLATNWATNFITVRTTRKKPLVETRSGVCGHFAEMWISTSNSKPDGTLIYETDIASGLHPDYQNRLRWLASGIPTFLGLETGEIFQH